MQYPPNVSLALDLPALQSSTGQRHFPFSSDVIVLESNRQLFCPAQLDKNEMLEQPHV